MLSPGLVDFSPVRIHPVLESIRNGFTVSGLMVTFFSRTGAACL